MSQNYKKIIKINNLNYFTAGIVLFLFIRLIWYSISGSFSSSYIDELLVVYFSPFFLLGLIAANRSPLAFLALIFYVIYLLFFVFSGIIVEPNIFRGGYLYIYGLVLDLKWFVLFSSFLYFAYKVDDLYKCINPIVYSLVVIAIINSFAVVVDSNSNGISLYGHHLLSRGSFWLPMGFFQHHIASVQVTILGYIGSLCIHYGKYRKIKLSISIYLFFIVIMHVSVKETMSVLLITSIFLYRKSFANNSVVVYGCLFAILAVSTLVFSSLGDVIVDRIGFYAGSDGTGSVRRLLYAKSALVALDYFPFGTGPSTFASDGARSGFFSPLYMIYGVYGGWGATYENNSFLVDVYWPKILAESGVIGLIFYFGFIFTPMLQYIKNFKNISNSGFFFFFVYLNGIISSIASPILNSELYATLFYMCLAFSLFRKNIVNKDVAHP